MEGYPRFVNHLNNMLKHIVDTAKNGRKENPDNVRLLAEVKKSKVKITSSDQLSRELTPVKE